MAPHPAAAQKARLRLLTFNVKIDNTAYENLSKYVENVHPDIVVLQEAGSTWLASTVLSQFHIGKLAQVAW